jgi:hypothetical protein
MACFVFCCFRIACASCQARTRLMATASTSSRIPSSSRKLSKVDPLWSTRLRLFFAFIPIPFGASFYCSSPAPNRRPAFSAFLDESVQKNHATLLIDIKENSRNSVFVNVVRASYKPSPSGLQTGIPIGQPNSIVLMSFPMRFLSSVGSVFSHSRTGSPPASVRKKSAGTRLPCVSSDSCSASGLT